jgi:hypothetical protein
MFHTIKNAPTSFGCGLTTERNQSFLGDSPSVTATWKKFGKVDSGHDMPTQKLTTEIITAAIEGFESQKTRIDTKIAELRAMLPGGTAETAVTPEAPTVKRKKFSAAARRRMKEAQQRRWAKIRGESKPAPVTPEPAKPKRKLSKAGKAAIVAATKKRWASVHEAEKAAVKQAPAKRKMSPARRAALVANLAKARAARAAKRAAA